MYIGEVDSPVFPFYVLWIVTFEEEKKTYRAKNQGNPMGHTGFGFVFVLGIFFFRFVLFWFLTAFPNNKSCPFISIESQASAIWQDVPVIYRLVKARRVYRTEKPSPLVDRSLVWQIKRSLWKYSALLVVFTSDKIWVALLSPLPRLAPSIWSWPTWFDFRSFCFVKN